MNDAHQPQLEAPQLRTLLLTDLCDSTELVEKLGDNVAAELFREHDLLVLGLQRQWRGRLIDRSDGLLLLFERPIDGLGFALDYAHGLQALGKARKLRLQARAGLHVGEVLTWRNSEEAISIGAKPLEVEGLAKPMAARLMSLARPGQILLSAVAESLTHRAARELGQRGERLLWKSHGRWRFKGVPTAQEIYEVGEVGLTPLRSPKSSAKAWRDLPLWRRPAALVAEVVVAVAIGIGIWIAMRPEPAIAFAERDWVVVGDLRNLTGKPVLDGALDEALRVSLSQSRYVNLIGDLTIRERLESMRRDPSSTLDRATASQIAVREGARAVILPSVTLEGGKVRFSAEVVDPQNQTTVYALSAVGDGQDRSVISAVDEVATKLRERLGEAMGNVATSAPLPVVTTSNLDALRAYALGQEAHARMEEEDARRYYLEALRLDPGFAMAEVGLFVTYLSQADYRNAVAHLQRAAGLHGRLTQRDSLSIDAWLAEFGELPAKNAPPKWKLLATIYPDAMSAHLRYAWWEFVLGDAGKAYGAAREVLQSKRTDGYVMMGRAALYQNRYSEAIDLFSVPARLGYASAARRMATAYAAARREPEAADAFARIAPSKDNISSYVESIAYKVDTGAMEDAAGLSDQALHYASEGGNGLVAGTFLVTNAVVRALAGDRKLELREVDALLRRLRDEAEQGSEGEKDTFVAMAAAMARIKQRHFGEPIDAQFLQRLQVQAGLSGSARTQGLVNLLVADNLRLSSDPAAAVRMLKSALDGTEHFQVHVALRDAYLDLGNTEAAGEQDRWLIEHRGTAYTDPTGNEAFVVMNVSDSNAAAALHDGIGQPRRHALAIGAAP